ncbi:hypothetical protein ACQPVP_08875 [Clostridium nigeriense]|uniref:hypothetical protein n=1 Tax=Clostridium nigeriense TaxID=1805470 RepID=UPI003D33C0A0
MTVEECKEKIRNYIRHSIDSLEIAMNLIECDDDLNNSEDKEIDNVYQKISSSIKILEDI